MYEFFNQGWVGSVIGLLGLVVGVIGLYLYFKSRIGPRPAFQMRSLRLIGKEEQQLPRDVQILFNKTEVSRLTLTRVWIWNCGTETIRGSQMVEDDTLRCVFDPDTRILSATVASATRTVNKFAVNQPAVKLNEAHLTFDFLDPNDGARVELLHTSKARYPMVAGTIRGIPKGIKDMTSSGFPHVLDRAFNTVLRRRKVIYSIAAVVGTIALIIGFLPRSWLLEFRDALKEHNNQDVDMRGFRFGIITVGALYVFLPLSRILASRKKYPACLDVDAEKGTAAGQGVSEVRPPAGGGRS